MATLAFDPGGDLLVSCGTDGTARLLDVGSRVLIGSPLPGVDNEHCAGVLTPDGKRVFVAYPFGEAFVWDVDHKVWNRHGCRVAGRELTRDEWAQFLPDRRYKPACVSR